jgi:hypothetical protein
MFPVGATQMQRFVDRVFGSGFLFHRPRLRRARHCCSTAPNFPTAGGGKPVRIADGIEPFDPDRRELYKSPEG